MTPGPAPLAAAIILAAALASGRAPAQSADCSSPAPNCAAELPAECLQRLGAGVTAFNADCTGKFDAYLACLDKIVACAPEPEPAAASACSEERETALWREARDSDDPEDFDFFLETCPDSVFSRFAESKRAALRDGAAAEAETRANAQAERTTLQARRSSLANDAAMLAPQITVLKPQLDELSAQTELARRNVERLKQLVERHFVSRAQYEQAQTAAQAFEARYGALVAQMRELEARYKQTQDEIARLDRDIAQTEKTMQ